MKTVGMSLNKANKCVEKIKQELGSSRSSSIYERMHEPANTAILNVNLSSSYTIDAMKKELDKKKKKQKSDIENNLNLITDLNNLKTNIFKANVGNDLNYILSELELTKRKIKIYKELKASFDNTHFTEEEITNELLDQEKKIALDGDDPSKYFSLSMALYKEEEIKKEFKELTIALNDLEDKKVSLNANTKISVELSEYTVEILGIA